MARISLSPGFRFHPTDVELVMFYLKRKVMGKKFDLEAIAEVNIYKFSPWDLPDKSCLKSKDLEWFFFCPREMKYASGVRVKRATDNGYWKTTGKDRSISYNGTVVGAVKTLVFHLGHAPQGERTNWVIHEYKIFDNEVVAAGVQDTYVLCKVFEKDGRGPKNGAQYGAPFNEADWTDDDINDAQNHSMSLPIPPEKRSCLPVTSLFCPGSSSGLPLVGEGPSTSAGRSTSEVLVDEIDHETVRLLAALTDDSMFFNRNGINQDDLSGKGENKSVPCSDGYDIYNDLADLDSWVQMSEGRLDISGMEIDDYSLNDMLLHNNCAYLELDDLRAPLNCSTGVTATDQSSVSEVFGSYSHENMQHFYSGGSFAGMDQYASAANQLPMRPEGSYEGDDCLDVFQVNEFFPESNAAYDSDIALGQKENGVNFTQDTERGTFIKICISRLMESIPARSPSAAEHLALSFSPCGGSSIHIKAEVTHGAGECTNEALSVMMGESGSCWCNLPWAVFQEMWLWIGNHLLYLVDFGFHVVLICCYLNEALSCFVELYYRIIIQMKIFLFYQVLEQLKW